MRKGQAALEFLTTYGWAFLVILVMIGALAYFGVLNPGGLLPSRCTFSPEIACLEHRITANPTNTLEFRFRNNVGQMAVFNFTATEVAADITVACENSTAGSNFGLKAGRTASVLCDFSLTAANFADGDKIKFEISSDFTKAGGSYSNPAKGEVYGEAQT